MKLSPFSVSSGSRRRSGLLFYRLAIMFRWGRRSRVCHSIASERKKYLVSICKQRLLLLVTNYEYKRTSKNTRNTGQVGRSNQGLSQADEGEVTPLEMSR